MFWDCNLNVSFSPCLPNPDSRAVLDNGRASLCPQIFWSRWWKGERRSVRGNQGMPWNSNAFLQFKYLVKQQFCCSHADFQNDTVSQTPVCGWQIQCGTYRCHTRATTGGRAGQTLPSQMTLNTCGQANWAPCQHTNSV